MTAVSAFLMASTESPFFFPPILPLARAAESPAFRYYLFHQEDIDFVSKQVVGKIKQVPSFREEYSFQLARQHRQKILSLLGWSPFEDKQKEFEHRIQILIGKQLLPRKVLWQVKEYLFNNYIESLSYDTYRRAITQALIDSSQKISSTLSRHILEEDKVILDKFLARTRSYEPSINRLNPNKLEKVSKFLRF
jgi:hypothetical protein